MAVIILPLLFSVVGVVVCFFLGLETLWQWILCIILTIIACYIVTCIILALYFYIYFKRHEEEIWQSFEDKIKYIFQSTRQFINKILHCIFNPIIQFFKSLLCSIYNFIKLSIKNLLYNIFHPFKSQKKVKE